MTTVATIAPAVTVPAATVPPHTHRDGTRRPRGVVIDVITRARDRSMRAVTAGSGALSISRTSSDSSIIDLPSDPVESCCRCSGWRKLAPDAMKPGSDGTDRDSQRLRDFFMRELAPGMKQERVTIPLGQGRDPGRGFGWRRQHPLARPPRRCRPRSCAHLVQPMRPLHANAWLPSHGVYRRLEQRSQATTVEPMPTHDRMSRDAEKRSGTSRSDSPPRHRRRAVAEERTPRPSRGGRRPHRTPAVLGESVR